MAMIQWIAIDLCGLSLDGVDARSSVHESGDDDEGVFVGLVAMGVVDRMIWAGWSRVFVVEDECSCVGPQAQHTPSCSSRQLSGGVCALGGEPSTRPDQQAPGQLKVSTAKVAQAGA
ncbi:unnamed protein product [Lupinus luteus]|uniref:Uncharacterized protein n=1 Tax=Lupinus luteus TaxID=3873 RepID=A0AAV1XWA9_LUPLU